MEKIHQIVEVNPEWIEENIQKKEWQRDLYPSRVNKFVNDIKNGSFRDLSTITTARDSKGNLILLDGQHKLAAIKATNASIPMDLAVFDGLNEDEMRDEYESLNDVKNPRTIDDIKLFVGRNDVIDTILDEKIFPINVSLRAGINSVRIDKLLGIYYNGLIPTISRRGFSRKVLKEWVPELTSDDFVIMRNFFRFFKKCFGDPSRDNWVYKMHVITTIMRFWLKNHDDFTEEEMVKKFKPILKENSIMMDSQIISKQTIISVTYKIYAVINKGRTVSVFKKFWQDIEDRKAKKTTD